MADTLAELVAQTFHEAYEKSAPDYGYKTREETAKPWKDLPPNNKGLMIATAGQVLEKLGLLGLHVRLEEGKIVATVKGTRQLAAVPPPPPVNGHPVELSNGHGGRVVQLPPKQEHLQLGTTPTGTYENVSSYKQSRERGFEGDACGACQQMTLKRNGSCLVCTSCGETSGCS